MMRSTSLDAYSEIKPALNGRQAAVFDTIQHLKSPTNAEISRFMGLPINQITPRTNELVKKGRVVESHKRACGVTGRTVWSWRVIGR